MVDHVLANSDTDYLLVPIDKLDLAVEALRLDNWVFADA